MISASGVKDTEPEMSFVPSGKGKVFSVLLG